MDWLRRLDDWAARRWPRLFARGSQSTFMIIALIFMIVGVVCLELGGEFHAVGVGASGAAIGSLINGIIRRPQDAPASDERGTTASRSSAVVATQQPGGWASEILAAEQRVPGRDEPR